MRLKQDRRVKFQLQLRHSNFIVLICHDVEVHEKNKGRVNTATLIGKLFAVLQFMQVINKQNNGIKHECMIYFCNCKQATYLLLPFYTNSC